MKKLFLASLSALCVLTTYLNCQEPTLLLQHKIAQAQEGDYIVTAQDGNYSLLFLRSQTADILLLEEISVPEKQIDLKKIDWKKWVETKAPGHTSWTLYEIDRKTGSLIECFSYSKNGWLYLDESEQFLTKLLTLPLHAVAEKERKRIGPQPTSGEIDQRAAWNPPLIIEGKKLDKAAFEVWKAKWPDDGTRLSLCTVELYFSKQQPNFPFPYWLEVQSPHYAFKMRAIDSGHGLHSPMLGSMPHRPPQFLGPVKKADKGWQLSLQTPAYFKQLHLFVIDLTGPSKATIPVPFTLLSTDNDEEKILEIAIKDVNALLTPGHRYRWVIIPEGDSHIYVESEETFNK